MAARRRALEFEEQPIPHAHHLPHPKFLIGTAALLALLGGYALSRSGEPNADQQFVPQTAGQDLPPAGSGGDGEPPKLPVTAPPQPTEIPKVSPLEQAIRAGKIELNNLPLNSVIPMSDLNTEQLNATSEDAINNTDFRFILPLNIAETPNLVLETIEYRVPKGLTRVLGLKNIPTGTIFYSPISGEAKYLHGATVGGTLAIAFEIKTHNTTIIIMSRREGSQSFLPPQIPTKINKGAPLFSLGVEDPLGFYRDAQQVVIQFSHESPDLWDGRVENIFIINGGLVFIDNPKGTWK